MVGVGWLSDVRFPYAERGGAGANWALRLLIGASLVAFAQLALAVADLGFSLIPAVLLVAVLGAIGLRFAQSSTRRVACHTKVAAVGRGERVGWALLGLIVVAAPVRSFVVPEAGLGRLFALGPQRPGLRPLRDIVTRAPSTSTTRPWSPCSKRGCYFHRGATSIDLGKTVWAVVGSAFAICLAWHLRLGLRPTLARPGTSRRGIVLTTTAAHRRLLDRSGRPALTAYLTLATLADLAMARRRRPSPGSCRRRLRRRAPP